MVLSSSPSKQSCAKECVNGVLGYSASTISTSANDLNSFEGKEMAIHGSELTALCDLCQTDCTRVEETRRMDVGDGDGDGDGGGDGGDGDGDGNGDCTVFRFSRHRLVQILSPGSTRYFSVAISFY